MNPKISSTMLRYPIKQRWIDLLLLFIFTIITIIIRGYEYGVGDQIHFLTYVNYKLHPNLYPVDYLLKTHSIPYTMYVDFIRFLPWYDAHPQLIVFLVYLIGIYLFYIALFYISLYLFNSKVTAWLSMLLLIIPIFIGGSTILTVEDSLIPRMIAETFLLVSLLFLFKKKFTFSSVLAAVGFLFHPLTLLPYPIILLTLLWKRYISFKQVCISLVFFLLIVSPFLKNFFAQQAQTSFFLDKVWKRDLYERMPYIFVHTWKLYNFILLALIPVFFYLYQKFTKHTDGLHPIVLGSLIAGYGLFLISCLGDLFNIHFILQLQLPRNLYLTIIMCLLYAAALLVQKFRYLSVHIIVCIVFIAFIVSFRDRVTRGIFYFRPLTEYESAAVWARSHTPIASLFLVDPNSSGFRFWSLRSVFTENKEGGDSLYDHPFALVFDKRQDVFGNTPYTKLTSDQVNSLIQRYHFTDMVTHEILPYHVIFKTGSLMIYQLPRI